jgi:hypothetical protein
MAIALMSLGGLLALVGTVGGVWLMIEAFRDEALQGVLCLCVPFYALYFGFARLHSPSKPLILTMWLGGGIVGNALLFAARAVA